MKPIRNNLGQYTRSFVKKVIEYIKRGLAVALAVGLVSAYMSAFFSSDEIAYHAPIGQVVQAEGNFEGKIAQLRTDVIDRLETCESQGVKEEDGFVKIDNNSRGTLKGEDVFSFGTLQWKIKTVKVFVKSQEGKTITSKEAIEIALDQAEARKLADYTIFETDGGIHNWENCANKLGLVDEVGIIKKIMK